MRGPSLLLVILVSSGGLAALLPGCGRGNDCGDAGVRTELGCVPTGGDGPTDTTSSPKDVSDPGQEQPSATTRVYGLITDPAGALVGDATVSVGGAGSAGSASPTVSDASGRFQLEVPGLQTSVLVVEKTGYAPSYSQLTPGGAPTASVGVTLHPVGHTEALEAAAGGSVPVVDNTVGVSVGSVSVPPAAFVDAETGEPVASGAVEVAVTWVGPQAAAVGSPVPLVGTDGSDTWPLISYGMVDVTARANGRLCGLATDQFLVLTLPAAAGDPDSAGLFTADLAAGQWRLEGAATQSGGVWTAVLPHLSWWNVDAFFKVPANNQCCLRFKATKPNGKAASGVEVRGTIPGGGTFGGNTDYDGTLCDRRFPCGAMVSATWRILTSAPKSGPISVIPSAKDVECSDAECQVVSFEVPCVFSSDCPAGQTCADGLCEGSTAPDVVGGGDTTDPTTDVGPCTPQCDPGQCSDNGCGQPCLACGDGQTCGPAGVCVSCVPSCDGKLCGDDGCGGSCGICAPGSSCGAGGQCQSACDFCPGGGCNSFGFEGSTPLAGWDSSGDVAVIPQLGGTGAPEGGQMLRLSTGLAIDVSSYAQKALCASGAATSLSFRWRLYSEEFEEFCGGTYQDYFTVSVEVAGVRSELFRVTIDDLCPAGTNGCTTCGAKATTLEPADVSFDHGDVHVVPWQLASLPLPPGAANGTLIFEVRDIGDSAYDTVVLIDAVVVGP